MKNVKVYDCFLNSCNNSFIIRTLKIALTRTFIFNFNNNDIYYRKENIFRKMILVGKHRAYLINNKHLIKNIEYDKYNMSCVDNVIKEYVSFDNTLESSKNFCFDVVEKKKNRVVTSDSLLRKIRRDELVTMCFDESICYENVNI